MVCRSTAGNTAATTIARNLSGLHDVQVLSLFHEVRSEAPRTAAAPDGREVNFALLNMFDAADRLEGTMASRHLTTLRTNISRAADAQTPAPDGRTYYAWRNIQARAILARAAMETHFGRIADRHGSTPEQVEESFNRMMAREYRLNNQPASALAPDHVRFSTTNLPHDRGTRFALAMLYEAGPSVTNNPRNAELAYPAVQRASETIGADTARGAAARCADCGEFMSLAGEGHTCPVPTAETPANATEQHEAEASEALAFLRERLSDDTDVALNVQTTTIEPPVRVVRREPAAPPAAAPDATVPPSTPRRRTPMRNYATPDGGHIRIMNVSAVRAHFRDTPDALTTLEGSEVTVRTPDGIQHTVTGPLSVGVTAARRSRNRDRYGVTGDPTRPLRCTCPDYRANYDCEHIRQAVENVQALLNQRDPVAVAPAVAMESVSTALREEFDDSLAAAQEARAEFSTAAQQSVSYGDNMSAFQTSWDEAKAGLAESPRLPYMTENATNGLGAREGGRSFGIEIEVDFPDDMTYEAKHRVARELFEAGLSDSPQVRPWHWRGRETGPRGQAYGGGYTDDPNMWCVEFDRSVDDVGGDRGCELVSPILYDTPQTWHNLATVCEIVERNGGRVTQRTGLHINVGAADFDHTVENHNRLIGLANAYEDVIVRASNNPTTGPDHRGREYCRPMTMPTQGFTSIREAQRSIDARDNHSSHRAMINLDHVPAEGAPIRQSTRVEVRIFDGSIDPGRIQANIKMSLGMVNAAVRGVEVPTEHERAGTHRANNVGPNGRMRRLTGEDWERDTATFRTFADTIFARDEDKKQMTYLFAASRWQRR